MIVPLEILELILLKCDGKTLLTVMQTSEGMRNIVEYLGKKTKIWEWCCREEIPSEQLVEYLPLYESYGSEKWDHIYYYWRAWEDCKVSILPPTLCPINITSISAIALSSHHIAVGSQDGRVRLCTKYWQPVFELRIAAVKVTSLTFIGHYDFPVIRHNDEVDICLVIARHKGLAIVSYDGINKEQHDILDVKSHSIFGNYICIEKVGGRMTIFEVVRLANGKRDIKEIWFTRIYSPRCITTYKMWNGKCTFLINNCLRTVNYTKPNITPMEEMENNCEVKFYAPLMLDSSTTQIFRDDVIINIYKNADKSSRSPDIIENYLEIVILGPDKQQSKKLFNSWEILRSNITCVYLYGNSFVIGTSCGAVYFYLLNNWKNFDLKCYISRQIVGRHPIIGITAKETLFLVCSKFAIHKIRMWFSLNRT